MGRILLIEDEKDIADLIQLQGEISGYQIFHESDGLKGLMAVRNQKPDLILLDVMLPGLNGLEVCRKVKSDPELRFIPIIIISAKGDESEVVHGLEIGADDYVCKPFSPKILFSKIKAIFRRNSEKKGNAKTIKFSVFEIDTENYTVSKRGVIVSLTLSEFGILKRLVQNKGKVLTRNQLLDEVQGEDSFVIDRNIDVHIAAIRRKLGTEFLGIETVRGVGYRFTDES